MDFAEIIKETITPELYPMVVVLYVIGIYLKNSMHVSNKWIPAILGIISIIMNTLYILSRNPFYDIPMHQLLGMILTIFVQAIMMAACAVYFNQIIKQSKSDEGLG